LKSTRIGERREPVTWCVFIALFAGEHACEHAISALGRHRPRTIHPRRVMADMLVMPAFELGDPMLLGILKESNDALVHEPRATPARVVGSPWRPRSRSGRTCARERYEGCRRFRAVPTRCDSMTSSIFAPTGVNRFSVYLRFADDTIAAEYSAREEADEVLVRTIVFVEALLPKLRHRRISKRPIHLQPSDEDVAPRSR